MSSKCPLLKFFHRPKWSDNMLRIGQAGDQACEEETLAQRRGDDLRSDVDLRRAEGKRFDPTTQGDELEKSNASERNKTN
jgi:hypothetical protein